MNDIRKLICLLFIALILFSCETGVFTPETKIPSDQFIWLSQWVVPFIDGKTGNLITETGLYDEYIVYDAHVDTMKNWFYPVLIVLIPNYSGSGYVFLWRLPKNIKEADYKEIIVFWGAKVFDPDTFMNYFPQFNIVTDSNTDPNAPDSNGFVSISHRPTDINSFLPKPEDDWHYFETTFNYPEYDELKDGIYLTLIRPKNLVVLFGVKIHGITR